MVRFCPECGVELNDDFKFCPSCGYNLKGVNTNRKTVEEKIIECENCGTENSIGTSVCKGCGIKLKGEVKTTKVTEPVESQKYSGEKRKQVKASVPPAAGNKQIDSKKLIMILVVLVGAGLIILFAAGVFDKPVTTNFTNTGTMQNQNSGVDLSAIQKINELEASVKSNPDNNELLLELAHLRNDSGMYEKAIENYQEYLNRVPDDANARIDMGVCYYNLGRYEEAKEAMTKALEYSPKHQIGHLNLGIVNLAAGNIAESKEWLQKAVDLGPDTEVGKRAQELLHSH
jgi:uncharacterized membrane protein YvbJ